MYKNIGLPPAKRFILSHRARLSHVPFYCREAMVTWNQSSHATWCCLMKLVVVRIQHHHVLSGASCAFIHPCSGGFVLVLRFRISSCTCRETVAPSSFYWHHVHLLHLVIITMLLLILRGFTAASRTEHIPKYSSIEKFIKLPFQRESFDLIGVRMREIRLFHFSIACCQEFQHVQPSVIRPYPLVGTSDCLAAWFVGT
jgi:hypothetical protein